MSFALCALRDSYFMKNISTVLFTFSAILKCIMDTGEPGSVIKEFPMFPASLFRVGQQSLQRVDPEVNTLWGKLALFTPNNCKLHGNSIQIINRTLLA